MARVTAQLIITIIYDNSDQFRTKRILNDFADDIIMKNMLECDPLFGDLKTTTTEVKIIDTNE